MIIHMQDIFKRFKKNPCDSHVIKANGYIETYDMDITREEPVIFALRNYLTVPYRISAGRL